MKPACSLASTTASTLELHRTKLITSNAQDQSALAASRQYEIGLVHHVCSAMRRGSPIALDCMSTNLSDTYHQISPSLKPLVESSTAFSPTRRITNYAVSSSLPPTFIFHGAWDDVVPIASPLRFLKAVSRTLNVPIESQILSSGERPSRKLICGPITMFINESDHSQFIIECSVALPSEVQQSWIPELRLFIEQQITGSCKSNL